MNTKPFKAVGERFVLSYLIYEVEETDIGCEGCSFFYEDELECTLTPNEYNLVSYCGAILRPDGKSVIFKQVGEVP